MIDISYIKPEKIWLKTDPNLDEKWVQKIIADDPSILGFGDLILKDKERSQPRAGRLDLLLQDLDSTRRYEVEIQLGRTDESHIIRAIEYWDIERKRFPQYEHTAVIVAEDITSRFLNVIGLFNGVIPIIAIQMNTVKIGEHISLIFTTVLDQMTLGLIDEDEEVSEVANRSYWEEKATKATVKMADELLKLIHKVDEYLELKYNKFYIGLAKNGHPNNFVIFRPKKKYIRFEIRLNKDSNLEDEMANSGLDLLDYSSRSGRYIIKLSKKDIEKYSEFLTKLIRISYEG